jgi:hypothetical protein
MFRMRNRAARGALGAALGLTAVLASTGIALAAPAAPHSAPAGARATTPQPKIDLIGQGLVNCDVVTGEVGFSPKLTAAGTKLEMISVWFQGSRCTPATPGAATRPVPKTVIGSITYFTKPMCPIKKQEVQGQQVDLTYNYPPVPTPTMIDPSAVPATTVIVSNWVWHLGGAVLGSYPSPASTPFTAVLRTAPIGPENCKSGYTSLYIKSGVLANV